MSSHACGRVIRTCAIVTLLATLAGCSGRSTNPEDDEPESAIHDPFDNEEAELLALLMSGELCAPRKLYEQVNSNLATIRAGWGDSIPALLTTKYRPMWSPSYLDFGVDEDAFRDMANGSYTAWDSLNEYYHVGEIIIRESKYGHPGVSLIFTPRLDPRRLTAAYAGLPGVRWIQPSIPIGDWSCIYGGLHGATATYLFRNAWGDCPVGCLASEFWYFRANGDSVEYVGYWKLHDDTTPPSWWDEARANWEEYYGENILWVRTDIYVPTAITDLRAENPGSNEVTLTWTAPSDSSYTSRVGSYLIAYALTPITEETWNDAHHAPGPPPSPPGVHESFRLTGLTSSADFYFAIKSGGSDGSTSPLSNTVSATTLQAPGWSTFDSTNSSLASSMIDAMAADSRGGMWFGTRQGAVNFDGSQWHTYSDSDAPMPGELVTGMAGDESGNVWFVTYRGVHVFDGHDWTLYRLKDIGAPGALYCVTTSPNDKVWTGGLQLTVAGLDNGGWTVLPPPVENQTYALCQSMAADASGNVWVATVGLGLFRYDGNDWTSYTKANSGVASNHLYSVAVTSTGTVWVSYDDYNWGVGRFDGTSWEPFSPSTGNRFIMVDSSDRLWIASAGVVRFDGMAWTSCKTTSSGLVSDKVRSIVEDANGNMWFGTDRGASRLAADCVELYFGATAESTQ